MPRTPYDVIPYVDEMWRQYMETALWSSTDESDDSGGQPLDKNHSPSDIVAKDRRRMLDDCKSFYDKNRKILLNPDHGWPADRAGHELWLSRNGHGSGFFDSESGTDESREQLQAAAEEIGRVGLTLYKEHIYQGPG